MAKKILEKDIEGYLWDEVRRLGFNLHKYINDSRRGGTPGLPDDVVILPNARVDWVECKQPQSLGPYMKKRDSYFRSGTLVGCSRTEVSQFREQERLIASGHNVFIIGTYDQVDDYVSLLETMYCD